MKDSLLIPLALSAPLLILLAILLSTRDDSELIAAVLIFEAGGEGTVGMRAVMNVIQNRVMYRHQSFRHVVLSRGQFQCTKLNGFESAAKTHHKFNEARQIALEAINHELPDITGGADHFVSIHASKQPHWVEVCDFTVQIGNHNFFKERK